MPRALRGNSGDELFGLPHLGAKDFQKVRDANHMLFGAVRTIKRCLKLGIPGYLENPQLTLVALSADSKIAAGPSSVPGTH